MVEKQEWREGHRNYKKITFEFNKDTKEHFFHIELLEVDTESYDSIYDIFAMHLSTRQTKYVEVLYSGGLDSEIVLIGCMKNKIPTKAITMRIMSNGYLLNTRDIYYAEKFCRNFKIEQKFLDLDVDNWFDNGNHLKYLDNYKITEPHVSTQLWLVEQCSGFPVLGGSYTWPQTHKVNKVLSPHKHCYSVYDKFMSDNNIHGIGNMQNYSLEANLMFIKSHLNIFNPSIHNGNLKKLPVLKRDIFTNLGFNNLELRQTQHGWEIHPDIFDAVSLTNYYRKYYGLVNNSISWGDKIGTILSSPIRYNNTFG